MARTIIDRQIADIDREIAELQRRREWLVRQRDEKLARKAQAPLLPQGDSE